MDVNDAINEVKGVSKWPKGKLWIGAILVLAGVIYLILSFVHTPKKEVGVFSPAALAVTAPKVPGPTLKVPLMVVPTPAVIKKFPKADIPAGDAVIDTADISKQDCKNGVNTITYINVTTGRASTIYTPKPSPLFAVRYDNTIGVGYQFSDTGKKVPIYYKRDIAQIKDVYIVGEARVMIPADNRPDNKFGWQGTAAAEWRFGK